MCAGIQQLDCSCMCHAQSEGQIVFSQLTQGQATAAVICGLCQLVLHASRFPDPSPVFTSLRGLKILKTCKALHFSAKTTSSHEQLCMAGRLLSRQTFLEVPRTCCRQVCTDDAAVQHRGARHDMLTDRYMSVFRAIHGTSHVQSCDCCPESCPCRKSACANL